MRIFSLMITAVILLCAPSAVQAQVATGQKAPEFALTDTTGKSHSLSSFKDKYVVLEWFNYDCPFVVKHYGSGNMQGLQKEFADKGVIWLSINSSAQGKQGQYAADEMNALAAERGAKPTAILLDSDGKVGRQYGAQTTPHMYIVDPSGTLIYQGAIDDKPSADPSDIPQSKNYVKAALEAAMSDQPVADPTTKSYGCSVKY